MNEKGPETKQRESTQELLELVTSYLDDWDDEIPGMVVSSADNIQTKARKGWFQGVVGSTDLARQLNIVSKKTMDLCDKFDKDYITRDFSIKLTTAEDIERGNEVLEALKDELENDLGIENN